LDAIDAAAQAEVAQAMQTADAAAWPDPAGAFTDIQTTGDGQWY
jgi:pyruvate dehydrogenase E1 component alpha subunit